MATEPTLFPFSEFWWLYVGFAAFVGVLLFLMIMIVTGLMFLAQKRWVHYE